MTPELRAATVLDPLGNWFASNPKVVAAVAAAIRDAERAAYERAAEVVSRLGRDKYYDASHPEQIRRTHDAADAILALIDKEPTDEKDTDRI
jgi:transglutaminase-like putative cysteine protease